MAHATEMLDGDLHRRAPGDARPGAIRIVVDMPGASRRSGLAAVTTTSYFLRRFRRPRVNGNLRYLAFEPIVGSRSTLNDTTSPTRSALATRSSTLTLIFTRRGSATTRNRGSVRPATTAWPDRDLRATIVPSIGESMDVCSRLLSRRRAPLRSGRWTLPHVRRPPAFARRLFARRQARWSAIALRLERFRARSYVACARAVGLWPSSAGLLARVRSTLPRSTMRR